MLGKFRRKTMKRTFVQPNDKTLYYLPGQQFQILQRARGKQSRRLHESEAKTFEL
jgi:hypothetical protein